MKERGDDANYIWTQKTYLFERDGLLAGNPNGARNDRVIETAFQYGLIDERGFLSVRIHGDECEVKMVGYNDGTVFYHDRFKRTGTGKRYHLPVLLKTDVD
jgi:hypothetical protein